MTAALALLLATAPPATPLDLLQAVRDHYQNLSSFAMRVENQDSSGLFPGRYTQMLKWRRGGHFELRVTSKGNTRVPDYFADGKQVLSIRPGNVWIAGELMPDANTMPGWEVSSGPILGWLQNTPSSRFYLDPPGDVKIRWEVGPRTTWKSRRVRELLAKMTQDGQESPISFFVDPDRKLLIGMEYPLNGKLGSALYGDQKFNPALPRELGESPATDR
jgi:hypothetical protein